MRTHNRLSNLTFPLPSTSDPAGRASRPAAPLAPPPVLRHLRTRRASCRPSREFRHAIVSRVRAECRIFLLHSWPWPASPPRVCSSPPSARRTTRRNRAPRWPRRGPTKTPSAASGPPWPSAGSGRRPRSSGLAMQALSDSDPSGRPLGGWRGAAWHRRSAVQRGVIAPAQGQDAARRDAHGRLPRAGRAFRVGPGGAAGPSKDFSPTRP